MSDSNPISDLLGDLNDNLKGMGADFKIGATAEVPCDVHVGDETTIETHVKVEITENGWDIIDPDAQVERIVGEMKDALR